MTREHVGPRLQQVAYAAGVKPGEIHGPGAWPSVKGKPSPQPLAASGGLGGHSIQRGILIINIF